MQTTSNACSFSMIHADPDRFISRLWHSAGKVFWLTRMVVSGLQRSATGLYREGNSGFAVWVCRHQHHWPPLHCHRFQPNCRPSPISGRIPGVPPADSREYAGHRKCADCVLPPVAGWSSGISLERHLIVHGWHLIIIECITKGYMDYGVMNPLAYHLSMTAER